MKRPNKKHNNYQSFTIELLITITIALCMIFLVNFANNKLDEIVSSDKEALLMNVNESDEMHQKLAEQIIQFRPDACKMIEVFSEDYQLLFKVQFKAESESSDLLIDHKDLISLFESESEGHTTIDIGDSTEDVYFRWELMETGQKCLVIIYMSKPVVKNIWIFSAVSYTVIILVFILLVRILYIRHEERVEIYRLMEKYSQDNFL